MSVHRNSRDRFYAEIPPMIYELGHPTRNPDFDILKVGLTGLEQVILLPVSFLYFSWTQEKNVISNISLEKYYNQWLIPQRGT
jgi:hypothetical protein